MMNRTTRSRFAGLTLLMLCTALFAGCEGDTGDTGATGATGPQGPAGPQGPSGTPGTGTGIPIDSVDPVTDKINAQITNVTVPTGGGIPVVSFTLKNDLNQGLTGLPASDIRFVMSQLIPGNGGASSQWRSYITRLDGAQTQGTTETGTAGTLVDNGDGTYSYTFAQALTAYTGATFDATLRHRTGFEVRGGLAPTNNAAFDFVPTGAAPTASREIVDNDTCGACHDVLEFHGGARFDTQYCVACHNPQTIDGQAPNASLDMKVMVHKIHAAETLTNAYQITGFGNTVYDFSTVIYPQDVRNCATCHDESDADTPDASHWRTVSNRDACGTCHDDINWAAGGHPGGLTFSDDTQCNDCHGPNATVNGGAVRVPNAHQIPLDVQSAKFRYEVVSVTDAGGGTLEGGDVPRITVRVVDPTNGDAPYDIQSPDNPFLQSSSGLRVDLAWTTADFSNMLNPANTATTPPFQPMQIFFANGTSVVPGVINNGNGTFTTSAPFALPNRTDLFPADADANLENGALVAIMEGRPRVDTDGDGTADSSAQIAAAGATFGYDGVTTPRRKVVEITRCNQCHEVLSLHGGNRTDNTELCTTCHNPNATDIRQRSAGACLNAETTNASAKQAPMRGATADVPIDFRYMIHAIHSGPAAEYVVCGNGNSVHDYREVHYPGKLNNCEGCHVPPTSTNTSYYGRDPATVLSVSIDAGVDRTVLGNDELGISPTTAACAGCHTGSLALAHMRQNGGVIGGAKQANGAVVNAAETCAICHGPGRSADTRQVHGVAQFLYNTSN
jgi:OmcA/MtrC family decaheme c-type cytochrome